MPPYASMNCARNKRWWQLGWPIDQALISRFFLSSPWMIWPLWVAAVWFASPLHCDGWCQPMMRIDWLQGGHWWLDLVVSRNTRELPGLWKAKGLSVDQIHQWMGKFDNRTSTMPSSIASSSSLLVASKRGYKAAGKEAEACGEVGGSFSSLLLCCRWCPWRAMGG